MFLLNHLSLKFWLFYKNLRVHSIWCPNLWRYPGLQCGTCYTRAVVYQQISRTFDVSGSLPRTYKGVYRLLVTLFLQTIFEYASIQAFFCLDHIICHEIIWTLFTPNTFPKKTTFICMMESFNGIDNSKHKQGWTFGKTFLDWNSSFNRSDFVVQ